MSETLTAQELLIRGIKWLSDNHWAQDEEMNKSQGLAGTYATNKIRVLRRAIDFAAESPDNAKWLHDYLIEQGKAIKREVWLWFFKIWSGIDSVNRGIKVQPSVEQFALGKDFADNVLKAVDDFKTTP